MEHSSLWQGEMSCDNVWREIIPQKWCINKEGIPIQIYAGGEHIQTKAFSYCAIECEVVTESEAVLIF